MRRAELAIGKQARDPEAKQRRYRLKSIAYKYSVLCNDFPHTQIAIDTDLEYSNRSIRPIAHRSTPSTFTGRSDAARRFRVNTIVTQRATGTYRLERLDEQPLLIRHIGLE